MAHDRDKVLLRLTTILTRINNGESLSVTELSKEFSVNGRTIQRDFNERLSSFPLCQDSKKWKMKNGYQLENSNSIEDMVVLSIMKKLIEGTGQKFFPKAKKLLNKINNYDIYKKIEQKELDAKSKELQQLENTIEDKKEFEKYLDLDEEIKSEDNILESQKEIKSYFNIVPVAIMKNIHSSQTALGFFDNTEYLIIKNNNKNIHKYNCANKLFDEGWRIWLKEKFQREFWKYQKGI